MPRYLQIKIMLTRNSSHSLQIAALLLAIPFVFPMTSVAQDSDEPVDFVKTIKPIFEKYCVSCHGEVDPDSFRIDIADEAMDYIVEESAEDSDIYMVMVSDDEDELMPPPDEENPVSESEIELVKLWIDQGANWPDGVKLSPPSEDNDQEPTEDPADQGPGPDDAGADSEDAVAGADSAQVKKGKPADEKKPEVDPKVQRVYNAIGSLHPAVIHLPIGLLLAAGLFAFLSLRGNFVMSDCAYYCLWLGAIGGVIGCATGWWFSPMERVGTVNEFNDLFDQTHRVFWHRTSALIVTAASLLLALFAAGARNRDPDDGVLWKLGLILLAAAIGWVGHEGGKLTHGKHLYDDLWSIVTEIVPSLGEEPAPVDDGGDPEPPVAPTSNEDGGQESNSPSNEGDDGVGDTSDET